MTTMLEQLELMREKMRQMSESELQLVRGLGEALNVADDRLREQVRQFAADRQAQPCAAVLAGGAAVGLLKFTKKPAQRFVTDADAGVGDGDDKMRG